MRYCDQQGANLSVLAYSVARKCLCYNVWQLSLSHHICGNLCKRDIYSNAPQNVKRGKPAGYKDFLFIKAITTEKEAFKNINNSLGGQEHSIWLT